MRKVTYHRDGTVTIPGFERTAEPSYEALLTLTPLEDKAVRKHCRVPARGALTDRQACALIQRHDPFQLFASTGACQARPA